MLRRQWGRITTLDGEQFDSFTVALANPAPRRAAMQGVAAAALAVLTAIGAVDTASSAKNGSNDKNKNDSIQDHPGETSGQ